MPAELTSPRRDRWTLTALRRVTRLHSGFQSKLRATQKPFAFVVLNCPESSRVCKRRWSILDLASRAHCYVVSRLVWPTASHLQHHSHGRVIPRTGVRSGSGCLNNFPRVLSGLRAGCKQCRVVHGGGRRLRRTGRRGGQLGAHHRLHLMLPCPSLADWQSRTHQAWHQQGSNVAAEH